MTNKEAGEQLENLREHCSDMLRHTFTDGEDIWGKDLEALDLAIKALDQEPCEDAISRKALFDMCKKEIDHISKNWQNYHSPSEAKSGFAYIATNIYDLPPVNPQPKIGHWILADEQNKEDVDNDNYRFICSECQCSDVHAKCTKVPYCWNCGARMIEKEDDKE